MSSLYNSLYAIGLALMLPSLLSAEIDNVTVRWRANAACLDSCIAGLNQQFVKMPGAAEVSINGPGGAATIRWKPRMKYSYSSINQALRAIGVSLADIHLTVRGTITHTGNRITLVSLGDDTPFILLSPQEIQPNRMAAVNNPDAYTLQPATYQQLIEAETSYRLVTVSGMLLMPWRSPPNYLIIESLQIAQSPPSATTTNQPANNQRVLFNNPAPQVQTNSPLPAYTPPQPYTQPVKTVPQAYTPSTNTPQSYRPQATSIPQSNRPQPLTVPQMNQPQSIHVPTMTAPAGNRP
jgi:hypothetical protein